MNGLGGHGLGIALGGRAVLERVDMALPAGMLVGLLGPNGAGKTTLLRILAGLLAPDLGEVQWDGEPLARLPRRQRARLLGYLAQTPDCHWDLSVAEVVALGRLPHRGAFRGPTAADQSATARALADCELEGLAGRAIHTLSGGEQRRVFLARALAGEPRVLLADEPVSGLDPAHQLDVMGRLQTVARGGAAVAVVMHDLSLAARFCDRVVLLGEGRIQGEGSPDEVLDDALLARVYGVRVARVLVEGRELPVVAGMAENVRRVGEEPPRGDETHHQS